MISLLVIALITCYIKEEILRLDHIQKPWQHTTYEENIFRDYTEQDIKAMFPLKDKLYQSEEQFMAPIAFTPFDWRSTNPFCIHPIRFQENCGSCWAFASSEVFSDVTCIHNVDKNYIASVQQLVSCDTANSGCNGGEELNAF